MKVTAPFAAYVPDLLDHVDGGIVTKGEEYDVPDKVGKGLVEQGWKSSASKAKK